MDKHIHDFIDIDIEDLNEVDLVEEITTNTNDNQIIDNDQTNGEINFIVEETINETNNENQNDEDDKVYLDSYNKFIDDFVETTIHEEPMLSNKSKRYTTFPLDQTYIAIWNLYKTHKNAIWVAEEADLSKDYEHFMKLTQNEKLFIKYIIAFFAASDGIVNSNLRQRFSNDIQIMEAQCFYAFQTHMENIHGEAYSLLLDTYVKDPKEKHKLINAITTIKSIKKKADWCKEWIDSDKTFAHRIVAFAVVEGVFFSGSFASIFQLKKRGILPGLVSFNQWISRDEGLHTDFACVIFNLLKNRLKESVVKQIVQEAVSIEKEFICESMPCKLLGMNSDTMCTYIEYVADRLLVSLGYTKIYKVDLPFDFMEFIDIDNKTNFFEKRSTDYQSAKTKTKKFAIDVNLINK